MSSVDAIGHCADPCLTANVYCAGRLDALIASAVGPLWRAVREELGEDHPGFLWLMRYGRRGDHLKLRFHDLNGETDEIRDRADRVIGRFLDDLPPVADGESPPASTLGAQAPPIDAEDVAPEPHEDRSLAWTHYRRSYVNFGGEPLLGDDEYVARFVRCLGCATDHLLASLERRDARELDQSIRSAVVFELLFAALSALGIDGDRRVAYLRYHRDWLLRFRVRTTSNPEATAAGLLSRFEERAAAGAATAGIRATAEEAAEPTTPELARWADAVRALDEYMRTGDRPSVRLEAFAPEPAWSPLFKVLHNAANQAGLKMLDEGLLYHLALRALHPELPVGRDRVALMDERIAS